MKYLLAFLALVSPVFADPVAGFYLAGDGIFMGTGTGWGTESDILRDLGLDVFVLDTLIEFPPSVPQPLDVVVKSRWGGLWAYHDGLILPDLLVVGVDDAWAAYCLRSAEWGPCPVNTVDITGNWSTDDLGGLKMVHLSVYQARQPMNKRCDIPEPNMLTLLMSAVIGMAIGFILQRLICGE